MAKEEKTNVMRLLDAVGLDYGHYTYDAEKAVSGVEVAEFLKQDPDRVFKTLVTVGKSREHYVFVIPAPAELNLKKAAAAVGEKNIEMIPQKELLPLTGYVHGGCSPIGMKKPFKTTVDESAILYDTIIFSAGKRGYQVELSMDDLGKVIDLQLADVVD